MELNLLYYLVMNWQTFLGTILDPVADKMLLSGTIFIFWINELSKWLDKPKASEIPDGKGIWQDIFSKIYKRF